MAEDIHTALALVHAAGKAVAAMRAAAALDDTAQQTTMWLNSTADELDAAVAAYITPEIQPKEDPS